MLLLSDSGFERYWHADFRRLGGFSLIERRVGIGVIERGYARIRQISTDLA